jgi:hypothetical protein
MDQPAAEGSQPDAETRNVAEHAETGSDCRRAGRRRWPFRQPENAEGPPVGRPLSGCEGDQSPVGTDGTR